MSYGLYIGKNHSATGHAWLAGYGDEPSSHWLEIVPRMAHPAGSTVKVGMTEAAKLPGRLIDIAQVTETARHIRVSYSYYLGVPAPLTNGGLNEHGVAVRDIWSPSRPELIAMTQQIQTGPNYSDLARLVLERAKTAREGVDLIEALIRDHGYSCYGGNSHIIADADEAWVVIEFSGGQGLWVAERLGPDSIRASRPGYILDIPLEPNEDFRFPPHFIAFAVKQSWYQPESGPFNVNAVYGDGKGRWDGVCWIESEMHTRAGRAKKIGFDNVVWAISTERLTGDTAGYGQVVPLIKDELPAARLLWHAATGAVTTPLVPVLMMQNTLPLEYGPHRYLTAGESARFLEHKNLATRPEQTSAIAQSREVTRSAFQEFKRLMHLAFLLGPETVAQVSNHWRAQEQQWAAELPALLESADILWKAGRNELAIALLERFSNSALRGALDEAVALANAYDVLLRGTGQSVDPGQPKAPVQIW